MFNQATNTIELEELVEKAAFALNCELDCSMTYLEQADFLRQEAEKEQSEEMEGLATLLEAAEERWFELEAQQ